MSRDKISFVRKPAKHGKEDFVFTIPRHLIKSKLIDPHFKYRITLEKFSADKSKILKMIETLDEKLIFGAIDQDTYYKLNNKYRLKLEELEL